MRTLLLFVFLGSLSVLLCAAEAARWLLSRTCPTLLKRGPLRARRGI